ncbi:NAD(P)-dependent oxidoreductase, partial [Xanthomonas citri pv. citri]
DLKPSLFSDAVGSIIDPDFVRRQMAGVTAVIHTATLHKPHVATHSKQDFIDTNVTGTLNLLEAAVAAGVRSFVFTSTTSAFGSQLRPEAGQAAVWVTEDLPPVPKNIYGTTKLMAENLCELFLRERGLPVVILRTSRFFPEDDDDPAMRSTYPLE